MSTDRRPGPVRRAVLDELGCFVLVGMPAGSDKLINRLEATFGEMAQAVHPATRRAGQQWLRFLAEARAAAADVREIRAGEGSADGSGGGTTEPVDRDVSSGLVSPPASPLTVDQVASRLNVSAEYVRRLCRDGRLEATAGAQWRIDPGSVEEFDEARSRR